MKYRTLVFATLLWWLCGCASKEVKTTPTGIEVPPEPTVAVPTFGGPTSEALPTKTAEIEVKKTNPKKGSKQKKMPVPTPPPAQSTPVFQELPADRIPFEVGERLEIDLGWMALPAGKAIMEVKEGPEFSGRPTFHLTANALSSKLVDTVYHVDNTAESFIDKRAFIPYKFLLHMVESKQLKETRVLFDHTEKKAHFWSKRISERWGNEDIDRKDELVPNAKDMFSGLYYARSLNYTLNEKQTFSIYENGKNWEVELLPVANEFVNSKVGAFQCWKILVTVRLNNALRPTGDIYMWLSDDSKKYLVKFDAKIKIGSLYGNLVSIREH